MRKTKLSTPAKICNLDRPSCDPVPLSISADGLFNAALWKSWQFEPPAVHQHPERKKVGHPSTQKLVRISSVNLMGHDQVSPWQDQRSSSILSRVSNKWTANFQSVQFLNKTLAWAHTYACKTAVLLLLLDDIFRNPISWRDQHSYLNFQDAVTCKIRAALLSGSIITTALTAAFPLPPCSIHNGHLAQGFKQSNVELTHATM